VETTNDNVIISLRQVTKSFGREHVLKGIDLDVNRSEIMVIMGGSGCGKSTVLRHMTGLEIPDAGSVKLFGQELTVMTDEQLGELRKRFGVLFQSGALIGSLTVGENVALPLREHTELDQITIEIIVKIKLELVGLREHENKMPAQLSGGMQKRAGLARAIALDPQILFYDEPSAGLDPVTSAQIDELIVALTKKLDVTSVVVTHEMGSAFAVADRMCMLDRGEMLRVGTRREFELLRDADPASPASEEDRLIRQFLLGTAEGPLTERQQSSGYADDLLAVNVKGQS